MSSLIPIVKNSPHQKKQRGTELFAGGDAAFQPAVERSRSSAGCVQTLGRACQRGSSLLPLILIQAPMFQIWGFSPAPSSQA